MTSGGNLHLNIPGASANVAGLNQEMARLNESAANQLTAYKKLAGSLQGTGMDSATEYSQQQNAALNGIHDTVHAVTQHTDNGIQETIAYDQSTATTLMSGQG